MKKMKLTELLERVSSHSVISGPLDCFINDIVDSSADVKKGSLFVCIKGIDADGHDYIDDAVKRGATAVITEKKVKVKNGKCTVVMVKDSKKVRTQIVEKMFRDDREKIKVTGITGTNGKTTVSYLVDALLKEEYKRVNSVIGTLNYKIGKEIIGAKTTTPSSIVTNKLVHKSVLKGVRDLVMEASSHALDQGRIETIWFDTAVVTNITRDHLDYHKTYKNYLNAKLKIVDRIKKGGVLVVNLDCESSKAVLQKAKESKVAIITYAIKKKADVRAEECWSSINGTDFLVNIKGHRMHISSSLIGEHNIYNILGAIGAVLGRVKPANIKSAIKKFSTVKGRLDKVYSDKFTVLVDYAHTPDSLEKVLIALNEIKKNRIITVFGAAGNRDKGKRPIMGGIAERLSDVTVLTSDNPRFEKTEMIIKDVLVGVKDKDAMYVEPDRLKAVRAGIKMAKQGDIVLLAGKGHEDYQEIKGVKQHFDDTEAALSSINDKVTLLSDLLHEISDYTVVQGSVDIAVKSVEESSKSVKKGSMFICIKGYKDDGHAFVGEAVKNGAGIIITEKSVKAPKNATVIRVKDTKKALLKIVDAYYRKVKSEIEIIGVTGTNGKTTVSYLTGEILKRALKKENAVLGTISYKIGNKKYKAPNTTPSNITTHKMIEEAVGKGMKYLVMEVSSHALDQGRVANIELDTAVITNITRDHLDYHKTFASYVNTKLGIADILKPGGTLVINKDDKNSMKAVTRIKKGIKVLTYSMHSKADIKASSFKTDINGSEFTMTTNGKSTKMKTSLIGEHNIYNILAAVGVTIGKTSVQTIKSSVKKFNTLKGRLEKVYTNGITVFIDFAHTPDGLEKVMTSLNKIKKGRLVTVFGTAGDRDKGKRPLMGRVAERLSDHIIITTDNPRFEQPAAIIKDILKGVKNMKKIEVQEDRKKAINLGISNAKPGDIVLITGKGHQMYQEVKGHKVAFDDRKIVILALKGK